MPQIKETLKSRSSLLAQVGNNNLAAGPRGTEARLTLGPKAASTEFLATEDEDNRAPCGN